MIGPSTAAVCEYFHESHIGLGSHCGVLVFELTANGSPLVEKDGEHGLLFCSLWVHLVWSVCHSPLGHHSRDACFIWISSTEIQDSSPVTILDTNSSSAFKVSRFSVQILTHSCLCCSVKSLGMKWGDSLENCKSFLSILCTELFPTSIW